MSPLLRKEIRLLLPAWYVALLLAGVPPWFFDHTSTVAGTWGIAAVGAAILAVSVLGREFALETSSSLLSQPVPRRRLIIVKVTLLAIAMVSVLATYWLSYIIRSEVIMGNPGWHHYSTPEFQWKAMQLIIRQNYWLVLPAGVVAAAALFAGGLWTSLVFRQMVAAFWVTVLVPGVLVVWSAWLGAYFHNDFVGKLVCVVSLVLYSIVGIAWSWRLFLRFEDTPFSWGSKTLPSFGELVGLRRGHHAHVIKSAMHTLIRQELSLHQTSLVAATILLVVNLVAMAVQAWGGFDRSSNLASVLELRGFIWLLIPLFLGASAIAEERCHGTLQAYLCLPVPRWRLFLLKFGVVAVLGVLLGAGGLLLTELLGKEIGLVGFSGHDGVGWRSVFGLSLTCIGLGFVGFYASSLSRTSLQSVGIAIVVSMFALFNIEFVARGDLSGLVSTAWIPILYWSALIVASVWLSYRNIGHLHCGLKRVIQNAGVLLLTITIVTTVSAGIYWRAWELVVPLEQKHGPSRIGGGRGLQIVDASGSRKIMILLPDGRVWLSGEKLDKTIRNHTRWVPQQGRFLSESNWTALAACSIRTIALRSDGSLWSLFRSENRGHQRHLVEDQPRRIGTETNWASVAAGRGHLLALKDDGSLWGWGNNRRSQLGPGPEWMTNGLVQISEDTDWMNVFAFGNTSVGVKQNGTTCLWWGEDPEDWQTGEEVSYRREPARWDVDAAETRQIVGSHAGRGLVLLVRYDGTVHIRGNTPRRVLGTEVDVHLESVTYEVGTDHYWESLAVGMNHSVAGLTQDGQIWRQYGVYWGSHDRDRAWEAFQRVSRHSDWVGMGFVYGDCLVGLAADGTLTCWAGYYWGEGPLAPTRRPLTSFNIFDETE